MGLKFADATNIKFNNLEKKILVGKNFSKLNDLEFQRIQVNLDYADMEQVVCEKIKFFFVLARMKIIGKVLKKYIKIFSTDYVRVWFRENKNNNCYA